MATKPPCKNCIERHIGCHSTCDRYIEWQDIHNSEKVAYNNSQSITNYAKE